MVPERFGYFPAARRALAVVLLVAFTVPSVRAADDKSFQRLKGTVGYQATSAAPFSAVVGRMILPDDALAITRAKSAALVQLPDSSIVGLGENTNVLVGAFNQTANGPGATITVNGGTLRFDIRRPTGATANYRFSTPTTQIAVRGTVGLLSFVGGNTTVGCLACEADSVTVTVGAKTFTLLTGQLLTISAAGLVVAGTLTAAVLGGFAGAGVGTSAATGASAATAGVAGATGAAAGTAATTAIVGGAVAAGGVAAAVSSQAKAAPQPTPTASLTVTGVHGVQASRAGR